MRTIIFISLIATITLLLASPPSCALDTWGVDYNRVPTSGYSSQQRETRSSPRPARTYHSTDRDQYGDSRDRRSTGIFDNGKGHINDYSYRR